MKIETHNRLCSGCTACSTICSKNAIIMTEDEKGFKYPVIDNSKCIDCGLCRKVCQCYERSCSGGRNIKTYAVKHPNSDIRRASQSGGLFYGMAEYVINNGGICYGAAVCDDLAVRQIRVDSTEGLRKLQGSTYVQSDLCNTYQEVAEDLNNENTVLYSGTSCMIDGLINFLRCKRIDTENLFTCDLICHGVITADMLSRYLKLLEEKHNKKIKAINFRNNRYGWHNVVQTYTFSDGTSIDDVIYGELYFTGVADRDCCYTCRYAAAENKKADITMADCLGIEKIMSDYPDTDKGVSLAVIHNEHGEKLLRNADLDCIEIDADSILKYNRHGFNNKPYIYDAFWKDYHRKGYEYCLKKYTIYGGIKFKIKRKILKKLKKW